VTCRKCRKEIAVEQKREVEEKRAAEEAECKVKEEVDHRAKEVKQEQTAGSYAEKARGGKSMEAEQKWWWESVLPELTVVQWKRVEAPVASGSGSRPTLTEMWQIKKQVAVGHIVVNQKKNLFLDDFDLCVF
jgi:hypothetical protein